MMKDGTADAGIRKLRPTEYLKSMKDGTLGKDGVVKNDMVGVIQLHGRHLLASVVAIRAHELTPMFLTVGRR